MRILLCSSQDAVRKKWAAALKEKYAISQASSYHQIADILYSMPVDLVLVHRSMIDDSQLCELCRLRPELKVFVLCDRPEDRDGVACIRAGCVGYGNTYTSTLRLQTAIEAVNSGLAWVGNSLMQYLVQGVAVQSGSEGDRLTGRVIRDLSPREKEIALLVAEGLPNSGIADRLDISERTVKAHLSAIYSKTGTGNRLALALRINNGS